jgi:carbon-monoxide dehydrogenase medium subunit
LLVSVEIPAQPAHSGAAYLRFIPRNEMDLAVVGVGASVALEDGVFRAARIALASVAPTPLFVPAAGESLIGKPVGEAAIQAASEIAQAAAKPITDMRGTAAYRRHLCGVMTRRALGGAIARARENR